VGLTATTALQNHVFADALFRTLLSPWTVDDTREGDVFLYLFYLDGRLVARARVRDDDDVATLDLGDTVALVADRLDGDIPNLALVDGRVGRTGVAVLLRR
jgi:hypothetical protein